MGEKYGLKRAKDCSLYVAGRLDGLTIDDISEKYDIPRRTLIRRIELLKVAYNEYKNNYSMFTEHNTKSATFGGYQKNQITNNGFKYEYGTMIDSDTVNTVIKNQSDYYRTYYRCDYNVWYMPKTDKLKSESLHDSKPIKYEFLGQAHNDIVRYCENHTR